MKNARVIYRRLEESLKKKSYINLNHRLVNSKDDLVEIASIFRDLRYETFRIIYLKGNRIVGYESISSRIPNLVQIFRRDKQGRVNVERCIYKVLDRMNRLEADNYYLVHNHPSDNAKASIDDLMKNQEIQNIIKAIGLDLDIETFKKSEQIFRIRFRSLRTDKILEISV